MLGNARLMAFIPVTDMAAARTFYAAVLGLPVIDESAFALVVDANGTKVRITPVTDLRPQPFTIAGWEVADIEATVTKLVAAGVNLKRFDGMNQRADGVWASPSGDLIAWFADPDGNTLSLTQFAGH